MVEIVIYNFGEEEDFVCGLFIDGVVIKVLYFLRFINSKCIFFFILYGLYLLIF